ncbi:MAG: 30S ribosomal protein S24e [Methanosarcinales archaeon]|nr:30S ribosomal protein S24e [Methanosarcinales archaeon]
MEIQIIKETNNPLLNRREVIFKVTKETATPSRKSVVEKIAATMNSKPGLVMISRMNTEFGKRETIGYAKIYETEERARQVENDYVISRNTFGGAKKEES